MFPLLRISSRVRGEVASSDRGGRGVGLFSPSFDVSTVGRADTGWDSDETVVGKASARACESVSHSGDVSSVRTVVA
jgi:hypothetical protein